MTHATDSLPSATHGPNTVEVICYQPVDGALLELFQLDSDTFPTVGERLRYYDMTIIVERILPISTESIAHIAFGYLD